MDYTVTKITAGNDFIKSVLGHVFANLPVRMEAIYKGMPCVIYNGKAYFKNKNRPPGYNPARPAR